MFGKFPFSRTLILRATHVQTAGVGAAANSMRVQPPKKSHNMWQFYPGMHVSSGQIVRDVGGRTPDTGQGGLTEYKPSYGLDHLDTNYFVAKRSGVVRTGAGFGGMHYAWVDHNMWEYSARNATRNWIQDKGLLFVDQSHSSTSHPLIDSDQNPRLGSVPHIVMPSVSGYIDYHTDHQFDPRRNVLNRPIRQPALLHHRLDVRRQISARPDRRRVDSHQSSGPTPLRAMPPRTP